jgi:hypothetical protein
MPNFRQPDKSVSRAFVQNGVYVGNVTRTDEASQQIYVEIPRYVVGFEFGPLNVACSDLPVVGDSVACLFLENKQEDVMILGVIKNADSDVTVTPVVTTSVTRPASPKVGAIVYESDTEDAFVWSGTSWVSFGGGGVGAQGPQGAQGATGAQGIVTSASAPVDTSVLWADTGSTGTLFAPGRLSTNAQTGTSYTLVLADEQKLVECSNASAITLTVPLNSSVAYTIGTQIHVAQTGVGQVTVTPTGGVTINATPGLKTRAQWSAVTLIKRGTDTWLAIGDLSA